MGRAAKAGRVAVAATRWSARTAGRAVAVGVRAAESGTRRALGGERYHRQALKTNERLAQSIRTMEELLAAQAEEIDRLRRQATDTRTTSSGPPDHTAPGAPAEAAER
ncbi:MAG: hypothetical protein JJU45_08145 [Acidimicrobiia bacterium]|nr:hypothetical protein [Acidimicrobiia bacterium]